MVAESELMRGKLASLLAIVSALAILASGCTADTPAPPVERRPSATGVCGSDPFGCVRADPGKPIRLAALVPFGQADPSGEARFAIRLAVQGRPLLHGHRVAASLRYDDCSPVAVGALAEDKDIAGVVASGCGSYMHRIDAEVLSEKGIVFLSATSTGSDLTHARTHPPFFARTTYNDAIQALAMARYVRERLKTNSAAGIHDRSPYARGLVTRFASDFSKSGGAFLVRRAVRVGETNFRTLLDRIEKTAPDFIYAPLFVAEGGLITSQAREIEGLRHTVLGGADGLLTPDWLEYAGRAAEGVYVSRPTPTLNRSRFASDFLPSYRRRFGREPLGFRFHMATAYDATNMILDAIEDVAIQEKGTLYIPRTALRDRMFATKDFPGFSGMLSCDSNGDCNHSTPVIIYQVRNSKFRKVWTWRPTA
ncbi:MAG TPA: branched-chain amino acid ABC transporter substrate-binding protein [Actinomycetota bacterium]|nr:branched-chain amino acid ABC transporter substrate-binding protein [Actinomycetota bacterium]